MIYYLKTIKFIILICIVIPFNSCGSQTTETSGIYTYQIEDYNGIGKWYMGREIASVMGFEGMEWLERPERESEENVSTLIKNMSINLEDTIADIGAGSGYHTFRMALKAPKGFIYAIDIQEEMLSEINSRINNGYLKNIAPILGTETNINLIKNSVDKILLVDVYHEFKYPYEMMESIKKALRPNGKIFIIEYRGEDPRVPIKKNHKMTEKQVVKEMKAIGLKLEVNMDNLPWQHCLIFEIDKKFK
ncbi:methyltransferase domain-containing protein [bacterium]|nr:methyltransferase domain-containing protein [bacterium]